VRIEVDVVGARQDPSAKLDSTSTAGAIDRVAREREAVTDLSSDEQMAL
jgi:hypothetical protein